MAHECVKCGYVVPPDPDQKPRPWCPRCGSDLKEAASGARPALAAAAVGAIASAQASSSANGSASTFCELEPTAVDQRDEPASGLDAELATTPEAIFTSKILWQAVAWLTAIVCFGIAGIALSQFINPPKKKPDPAALWGVAGLFGIGGLVACYVGVGLSGQKYLVFPDRLVAYQFFRPSSFRWNQIREVYRDVHPVWRRYRIVTRKGATLTVSGETRNYIQLGEIISERVATVLLPDALSQLEAGRSVSLGPLRLDRSGIALHGELVPWHEVLSLTFGLNPNPVRGNSAMVSNMMHLRITPLRQVELGEIPNYPLFEALVRVLHPGCLAPAP
jgi:hypothetical protein